MRFSLAQSQWSASADHIIDCDSPAALHHWLVQDRSGTAWSIAVDHGGEKPVLLTGGSGGALWVVGGWKCPRHVADSLWNSATGAIRRHHDMERFIGAIGGFTRGALYPKMRVISDDE